MGPDKHHGGGGMSEYALRRAVLVAALFSSSSWAAEPQPKIIPTPSWVVPVEIPRPDPAKKDAPLQVLLISGQGKFDSGHYQSFVEFVMMPQTVAGLQEAGTISLPWNVSRANLNIHAIEIRRAGQTIDLLKNADFTILRRETGLEKAAQLDGIRTVVMPAKGLELGDIVRVAASYDVKSGIVQKEVDDIYSMEAPFDVAMMHRRFLVSPGAGVQLKTFGPVKKPVAKESAAGTEYVFVAEKTTAPKYPPLMRSSDKVNDIQFSAYRSWSQVADTSVPHYTAARKIAAGSPLAAEADKIAAAHSDPRKRMMAALRLTQERVRYVAILLNEGAYVPTPAAEAWDQRFGDCKAKSAMLLGLLDLFGIAADAVYVSSKNGDVLRDRLPSLQSFDHVIVKATIDGRAYYLDATDYGQRVADEVAGSSFGYALPIKANAQLELIPPVPVEKPMRESELVWDASKGITSELPFTGKLTLRYAAAIEARLKKATAQKPEELVEYFENQMPGIENDDMEIIGQDDDEETGDYVVTFEGKAKVNWEEYEGMKGYRFTFSNDASKWDADFDRKEGPFKDAMVKINPGFWQREIEALKLPPGGKPFSVDAPPLDETIAATRIWRSVSSAGDRITSVTDFRHLGAEISAEEARKAETNLKAIADNWAFVVAPRGFKPPRQQTDAD